MARRVKYEAAHVDKKIAEWKTKLKSAVNNLDKWEWEKKKLTKRAQVEMRAAAEKIGELIETAGRPAVRGAVPVSVPAHPTVDSETTLGTLPPVKPTTDDTKLDIPGFLRRQGPSDADKAAADTIKAEQAATKKAKAQGRIATMKAKKSGETRKMPLTGKAALALINNG